MIKEVYKSEADCTGEMGAGQFSIFGAVEDKDAANFCGSEKFKRTVRERAFLR